MKYPHKLVDDYGAKAGILMYIKENLPDIPQVDMIVKTPDESIDSVLNRANEYPILWPRLLRSSAVAELQGYEGWFPSQEVGGPDSWFFKRNYPKMSFDERIERVNKEMIHYLQQIQESPQRGKESEPGKHDHLPDEIAVIIAEQSPSSIAGTYIKHPNQDGVYVISVSDRNSLRGNDPLHSAFISRPEKSIEIFEGFSKKDVEYGHDEEFKKNMMEELEIAISWHDQMTKLPELDKRWTYQIEFGLNPICLYQVRPFKRIEKANFTVKPDNEDSTKSLVIGITPEEGIVVRAEANDIWKRHCDEEPINPENYPTLFCQAMRNANKQEYVPNVKANILKVACGILAHEDIAAIRKATVSGIYSYEPNIFIEHGKWYNIRSDGKNINIREWKK